MKFRYSVRTGLIFIAIVACVFTWWRACALHQHHRTVADLSKLGCYVGYEKHTFGWLEEFIGIDLSADVVLVGIPCGRDEYSEDDFRAIVECLKQLPDLHTVHLCGLIDYDNVAPWIEELSSRLKLALPHINIQRTTV